MLTDQEIFSIIGNALAASAPPDWEDAWVTAKVSEDWARAEYDYKNLKAETNWFDPGFSVNSDITTSLITLRQQMLSSGHPAWNSIRLQVHKNGSFSVDFNY